MPPLWKYLWIILVLASANFHYFKVLQIHAEQNTNFRVNSKKAQSHKDLGRPTNFQDLILNMKATSVMKRISNANELSSDLKEDILRLTEDLLISKDRRFKDHKLDDSKFEEEELRSAYTNPHSVWNYRVRLLISALSTLKPVFLTLGAISAIRNGIYIIKKFRTVILPRGKKVWMDIVQELSFIQPFDYMTDFCPQDSDRSYS